MDCKDIVFSRHAIQRMFKRSISTEEVRQVVTRGEIIKDYPDDTPYPSYLLSSHAGGRPLHVVVAVDPAGGNCHVVTVYPPDSDLWEPDFKRRKTP